jgi:hypothetical protein
MFAGDPLLSDVPQQPPRGGSVWQTDVQMN